MGPETSVEPPLRVPAGQGFTTRAAMASWVLDVAPYGIFTTDANLVIREWNQWLVAHSGIAAEVIVGQSLLEAFPDLLSRRLDGHFSHALRGEVSVLSTALHQYLLPFPSPVREFPGKHMLQTARIAPLPAGDQIAGTVTIIEDVTQREWQATILRRQQEFDRLVSEALALLLQSEDPLAVASALFPHIAGPLKLDVYSNYLLSEDATELRLHSASGLTPEVRKTIAVVPLGEGFSGQVAARRTVLAEFNIHRNDSPQARDARRLGLRSFVGFPLVIGDRVLGTLAFGSYERATIAPEEIAVLDKLAQFVAIALDRAQRGEALRDAQYRLSQHASELELRIAERTAKLHETIAQLEGFSYTVAHDLRAPIRSLTGFTEVLLEDHAAHIPDEGQHLLRRLNRASHRLDALTRDLLKFSRIVRQDVKLAPVDVNELVHDILSVTPALQDGVLAVQLPLGVVSAQRTLLQQCLSNLFDNALKFAQPGKRASIVVRGELRASATPSVKSRMVSGAPFQPPTTGANSASTGPRWRIWVEDDGIGIPPEAHEKIFGIFERIPGPVAVEGTGIGLAIVARAMEQMGGACGVESTPGQGSRFWLELAPGESGEA